MTTGPSIFFRAIDQLNHRKIALLGEGAIQTETFPTLAALVSDFDVNATEVEGVLAHWLPGMLQLTMNYEQHPLAFGAGCWIDGFMTGLLAGRLHERERVAEAKRLDTAPPVVLKNAGRGRWGRRKRES